MPVTASDSRKSGRVIPPRKTLARCGRVVVKLGTSLLTGETTHLDQALIDRIVGQIQTLRESGKEVLIVTSGAIGAGAGKLGLSGRPASLPMRQAAAAVGQVEVMKAYERAFARFDVTVAQVLLTRDSLDDRKRYLNAYNTIEAILKSRAVPVINENDTVSVDEIRFGDNDMLSALVCQVAGADALVILTDVPGLCSANPRSDRTARAIDVVYEIDEDTLALAGGEGRLGTGGMRSKLEAARIATQSGATTVIASGREPKILIRIFEGENVGTLFVPRGDRMSSRKRWIAYGSKPRGSVTLDAGAVEAIVARGKSLLPSGIVGVSGDFDAGDTVSVLGPDGREVARGLTNYSSGELDRIRGLRSSQIEKALGQKLFDEAIHRDNLVVLAGPAVEGGAAGAPERPPAPSAP
ncbi:MAG: glutamate 5-kinase [Planctomycetota bacterium]|nr:glutamate 5-kinase [Planctomycetota bacterium]